MAGPLYPLFPVASFLAFVLVLLPLPWHLEAWNSGTCYYMMWTALACLNQFINSVVWANDAINRAPVFCDISTRITLAAAVGIPAASMCIVRRLYSISQIQAVATTYTEKRRAVLVDTLICVVVPIISLPLAYIVQGHRFDVIQEVGCHANVFNTLLSYFLVTMWPILFGVISFVYCVLTLRSFLQRQAQFAQFLASNKALSASRYFRLMALGCVEMMCTVPLSIAFTVLNLKAQPFGPWVSWEETHYNFSRVLLIPSVIWRQSKLFEVSLECGRWSPLFCAFVFFAFFGFAEESRKNYKQAIVAVLTACRIVNKGGEPLSTKPSISSKLRQLTLTSYARSFQTSLPVYASPPPRYQASNTLPSSTSLDEKQFIPTTSASECSFSAYQRLSESVEPRPRSPTASRASQASIVDYSTWASLPSTGPQTTSFNDPAP